MTSNLHQTPSNNSRFSLINWNPSEWRRSESILWRNQNDVNFYSNERMTSRSEWIRFSWFRVILRNWKQNPVDSNGLGYRVVRELSRCVNSITILNKLRLSHWIGARQSSLYRYQIMCQQNCVRKSFCCMKLTEYRYAVEPWPHYCCEARQWNSRTGKSGKLFAQKSLMSLLQNSCDLSATADEDNGLNRIHLIAFTDEEKMIS